MRTKNNFQIFLIIVFLATLGVGTLAGYFVVQLKVEQARLNEVTTRTAKAFEGLDKKVEQARLNEVITRTNKVFEDLDNLATAKTLSEITTGLNATSEAIGELTQELENLNKKRLEAHVQIRRELVEEITDLEERLRNRPRAAVLPGGLLMTDPEVAKLEKRLISARSTLNLYPIGLTQVSSEYGAISIVVASIQRINCA